MISGERSEVISYTADTGFTTPDAPTVFLVARISGQ